MKITKVLGIGVKSIDSGDNDKILRLLTCDGIISVLLRGVKKPKAKLKPASQPFCMGEFELSEGKGIPLVIGCEITDGFFSLTESPDKYYGASLVMQAASEVNYGSDAEVFYLVVDALKDLAYSSANPVCVTASFLLRLCDAIGYHDTYTVGKIPAVTVADAMYLLKTAKDLSKIQLSYDLAVKCLKQQAMRFRRLTDFELTNVKTFLQLTQ